MGLKYVVIQLYEGTKLVDELFKFDSPEVAMEVCEQLQDRHDWNWYAVVVRHA